MSEKTFKIIYLLFFGITAGFILSYGLAFFLPQFYVDAIGKMVCAGKIEYISFKQSYFCFTAANTSFDIVDAMFWVVFKRALLPSIAFALLFGVGFFKTARFLWHRRAAAGF
ncbi:MAG TPA: hypothetical protein VNB22_20040 [Pyrinomonadaceae bacterium]|jgi:hypothetical protein|nr:hypothetical protein [Pyrinomonadaceae bacterium]